MRKMDLLVCNGTIREYRPDTWLSRRRYSRAVDHRLRYVCPPDITLAGVAETLFWLLAAAFVVGCMIGCPVLLVRWCLGM